MVLVVLCPNSKKPVAQNSVFNLREYINFFKVSFSAGMKIKFKADIVYFSGRLRLPVTLTTSLFKLLRLLCRMLHSKGH